MATQTKKQTATNASKIAPAPAAVDPDMPEGASEIDDGDVDEILQLSEGSSITGEYRGFKLTRSAYADKKSTLHKFLLDGGNTVGIFGSFQLDQKLERTGVGSRVWVKYIGKAPLANGNTMHTYRVAKVAAEQLPF